MRNYIVQPEQVFFQKPDKEYISNPENMSRISIQVCDEGLFKSLQSRQKLLLAMFVPP